MLRNTSSHLIIIFPSGLDFLPQSVLQHLIKLCMKNFPKDFTALCRSGKQQLLKIALRDHCNLSKLMVIQTKQFCNCARYISAFIYRLPLIRINQFRIRFLGCIAVSPVLRTQIFRISLYCIILSAIRKNKFHIRTNAIPGILAAEHSCFAHFTACFAVKRKRDRIENRCLSGSGISGNQIKSCQRSKIQLRFSCVWSESTDGKSFWLHSFSSCISFRTYACCCPDIG